MNRAAGVNLWLLEVVRGQDVGKRIPLPGGTIVLGNAPGDGEGVNLSDQEGSSPRRMAARQALIEVSMKGPVVSDLESPGGTFVNRKRLLPGQAQSLNEGDVLQLGSVQLRVVAPDQTTMGITATQRDVKTSSDVRPSSKPELERGNSSRVTPLAFPIAGGPICRSWDDFLTISAQRWDALREELTSGRLASYLIGSGRAEHAPRADAPGSPDDRLDAWLGSLPTTRPSVPELDVHPRSLVVRGTPGAESRQSFRVSNVGFRLLKSRVTIEPTGTGWLSVDREFQGEFRTVDETVVGLRVATPETLSNSLSATVVVKSNGGSARVAVRLEPPGTPLNEPPGGGEVVTQEGWSLDGIGSRLSDLIGPRSVGSRVVGGTIAGMVFRTLIVLFSGVSALATLPGTALVCGVIGGILGGIGLVRRGGVGELPSGVCAGVVGGVIVSALMVATCQAIEPLLGGALSSKAIVVIIFWGILGAVAGGGSVLLVPERKSGKGGAS